LADGLYRVTLWNTVEGKAEGEEAAASVGGALRFRTSIQGDLAIAVRDSG